VQNIASGGVEKKGSGCVPVTCSAPRGFRDEGRQDTGREAGRKAWEEVWKKCVIAKITTVYRPAMKRWMTTQGETD